MCEVLLNTIEKVRRFASISCNFKPKAYLQSGRYVIDAGSILGIFSLDLTKPLKLDFDIEEESDKELVDYYIKQIEEFIVPKAGE